MNLRTFEYCFKEGFVSLFKNRLMSIASIGTIASCIFIISFFYIVVSNVNFMVEKLQNNIGIVVFFDENTSEGRILEIQELVKQRPEVYSVTYISGEEAWENFKADYFEGKEELLEGFEGANPLKNSSSLEIFLSDITRQGILSDYLLSLENVREVKESREVTDMIESIMDFIQYMSIILIMVLIFVSVFLISNTVRLAIELRKKEINIMKYIGATDMFIRGPFIIEGALIGMIGALIPLGIIYLFYDNVLESLINRFMMLNNYLAFMSIIDLFAVLVPLSLAIGIVIGVLGSMLTIHKHLRV